eukprot:scaffold7254_cov115-Isochrysis_galbana.AAC.7
MGERWWNSCGLWGRAASPFTLSRMAVCGCGWSHTRPRGAACPGSDEDEKEDAPLAQNLTIHIHII